LTRRPSHTNHDRSADYQQPQTGGTAVTALGIWKGVLYFADQPRHLLFRLDAARQHASVVVRGVDVVHLKPSPHGLLAVDINHGTVTVVAGTQV
jgi:hypothetical protein